MRSLSRTRTIAFFTMAAIFGILTFSPDPWRLGMSLAFPSVPTVVYPLAPFSKLVAEHVILVAASSLLATAAGLLTGIGVTRPWGRDFLPSLNALASMGQTFPPVAVLAVCVPLVGFGFKPTVIALFLYGLLPVLRNTIAGIESVPGDVLEAGRGMGMKPHQVLLGVELPLASPVIMAGVRTSTVINTGTAALGATIGAGGLGRPIIAGLIGENPAFILEGAILVGLLAVLADTGLGMITGAYLEPDKEREKTP